MTNGYILEIAVLAIIVVVGVFLLYRGKKDRELLKKREKESAQQLYELLILKEIGDRIGYSLDIGQIAEIISGSLHQFINFSTVSYIIIKPEKLIFKTFLEKSVNRVFVDEVRQRMIKSIEAIGAQDYSKAVVEEIVSGALLSDKETGSVKSFFNIPLAIGDKVLGILNIADSVAGKYKDEEMTLLYKITRQASNAVSRLKEVVAYEQRKLSGMVESISEGIVMTDKDYEIIVANPAAYVFLGAKDGRKLTVFDLIEKMGKGFDLRGKLDECVKLNKLIEAKDVLIGDRFFQIVISPVKNQNLLKGEEILGGVIILHDITREKELENLREEFTSMMVHELRTPLDGVRKIADLIVRRKAQMTTEKIAGEYAPIIYRSTSDMLELVNDLLDVAKIEAGRYEIKKENGNFVEAVSEKVRMFDSSAKSKNISLSAKISENLPKSVAFDNRAISEILNNLIGNSLKFTEKDGKVEVGCFLHKKGEKISVEIKQARLETFSDDNIDLIFGSIPDSIIVSVTDNGAGISKDHIPFLFNKFKQFKASITAGNEKGTGLGLFISKGIIESHGGFISVASEENKGSTFYFSLPL